MNKMREPVLDKVVVNIGVGEAGERLLKAQKVLEMVTGQKPTVTHSKRTNRDFGIRKGQTIGCKTTLRGERAEAFLRKALWVKENRVSLYSFSEDGNFSFGIPDYTDFEGMKYDPDIGIFGMDVSVTLKRRGYRIARRQVKRRSIPARHRMTLTEAVSFLRQRFNLEVVE
ncbi:MAG: 50S ribosomal protein L5 [Thermoplasmata archaeon]|uniref:Large ribosomal subunit protein uL5 n=1 Tax=Candidatus Sysuiplasma superficiale TaxID=2823368 RepID=A0A8J8CI68_9ARCH|nr:50S ribosomal protein L5 [Candidatus Sysuiplasma superficiale]MBX8644678.1 50S ribosomal protein L5 [Candidatus Sysuiplasma superficiale]